MSEWNGREQIRENLRAFIDTGSTSRSRRWCWEEVTRSLFERVHREAVGHRVDDRTRALLRELLAYPDVKLAWKTPAASVGTLPVIPVRFAKDGEVLSYFSMVVTVGTPQTVAAQELRLECMFPADDETEARHRVLGGAPPAP